MRDIIWILIINVKRCSNPCYTCKNLAQCSSCVEGYFLNLNKCYDCNYNCKTASDECKCDSCYGGFYLKNFQCLNCADFNCKNCPDGYNKLIIDENKCLDECKKDDTYIFEYKNVCYKKCPNNTYIKEDSEDNSCLEIVPEGYYLDKKNEIYKRFNNIHDISYIEVNTSEHNFSHNINCSTFYKEDYIYFNIIKTFILNNTRDNTSLEIKDKILENINALLNKGFDRTYFDEGNDFILNVDNANFTITTTFNQNSNYINGTTILLGQCEAKLKEKYNIPQKDSLFILKIDISLENVRKVEYDVYYPFFVNNFTKLDLLVCKNTKVDILIPIEIPKHEIDKYNMSSGLYNDLCHTITSDSGTDKSLQDRRDEFIDNNLTVCEEDCIFTEYDDINKKAICSCIIKILLPLISTIQFNLIKKKCFQISNISKILVILE